MHTKHIGSCAIALLAVGNVVLWSVFLPVDDGSREHFVRQLMGEIVGSTVVVLLACALLLSTRWRALEPYFGGLDRMYQAHKNVAMSAFLLLFAHLFLVPLNPTRVKPGTPLGVIAFLGILVLVLLTIAPRIPVIGRYTRFAYHRWRSSHRFIGVFFTLSAAHMMLVDPLIKTTTVPLAYVLTAFGLGTGAYLYATVLSKPFNKAAPFVVETIRQLNGSTVEVALTPRERPLGFVSGQFVFVRFSGDRVLDEPHPFTISSAPREDRVRLTIKSSGDFTRHLHQSLSVGADATLDGAYGMLDYKSGGPRQIWIAGGIGVTPFLSWIRDFGDTLEHEVDFYYTVRTKEEALFLDEIDAAARRHGSFRADVRFSTKDGSLTVEQIVNAKGRLTNEHIYLCGPIQMIEAFQKAFRRLGVPATRIHFEEFNFR